MIWLTWRQFRASAAIMGAALAALAVVLGLTGPGLADEYSTGIAACTTQGGDCSTFVQEFFRDNRGSFLATTAVMLVLPALAGLFWGAPLISRELEAGTHRLVWNQSVTRSRWLAVKLGLVGLATMAAAGLVTLAVSWWADPIDTAAVDDFPRMEPLVFAARGIVPVGYAAFAFALGVTVGMLVRRTVAAMAITLVVFVGVQAAMPLLVRPHLAAPTHATIRIDRSNLSAIMIPPGNDRILVKVGTPEARAFTGAWVLSERAVDASGNPVELIVLPRSGACAPPEPPAPPGRLSPACFDEIERLGYRQEVSYQPASRFWSFQAYETAIFLGLGLLLSGFCFWWLRGRLS